MLVVSRMRKLSDGAFTITELLVVICLFLIAGYLLLPQLAKTRPRPYRIICVNNLKNVALAFGIYATDNGGRFPGSFMLSNRIDFTSIRVLDVFSTLSNELSTPVIVYCKQDTERKPAQSFTNVTSRNISYFASLNASEDRPWAFLAGDRNLQLNGHLLTGVFSLTTNSPISWSKDIHAERGNVAIADGSVQQMSNNRLPQAIKDQEIATNLVAFP